MRGAAATTTPAPCHARADRRRVGRLLAQGVAGGRAQRRVAVAYPGCCRCTAPAGRPTAPWSGWPPWQRRPCPAGWAVCRTPRSPSWPRRGGPHPAAPPAAAQPQAARAAAQPDAPARHAGRPWRARRRRRGCGRGERYGRAHLAPRAGRASGGAGAHARQAPTGARTRARRKERRARGEPAAGRAVVRAAAAPPAIGEIEAHQGASGRVRAYTPHLRDGFCRSCSFSAPQPRRSTHQARCKSNAQASKA